MSKPTYEETIRVPPGHELWSDWDHAYIISFLKRSET